MSEPEQTGEIEIRSARVADVSFPRRLIELVVMPYETEALVEYHGRMITEICSRGAWGQLQTRPRRVAINRDHDIKRTVGKAIAFHPSRDEGLVAEVKVSETELGQETLVLAADDVLDASAGFALLHDTKTGRVYPDSQAWESRDRRRLNRLWLGHIALTPDPAYEGAQVLTVRERNENVALAATPNLEALKLRELREREAALDVMYSLDQR